MFALDEIVKTTIVCGVPVGTSGVVKKIWTGNSNAYLIELSGEEIILDESEIESST